MSVINWCFSKDYLYYTEKINKNVIDSGKQSRKPSDGSVCSVAFENVFSNVNLESDYLSSSNACITIGFAVKMTDRLIDYCLRTMNIEEESEFTLNDGPVSMKFQVKHVNCFFKPYSFQMADREKLNLAFKFKSLGSDLYKEKRISEAFLKFRQALQYILTISILYKSELDAEPCRATESPLDKEEVKDLLINIYNNLALCHVNYRNFASVIPLCTKSIEVQPNIKAFYRRALALIEETDYERAESDLLNALELDKTNREVALKLQRTRDLICLNRENYKKTVQKMFQTKSDG